MNDLGIYRNLGSELISKGKWFLNKATPVIKTNFFRAQIISTIKDTLGLADGRVYSADEYHHTTDIETWRTLIADDWTNKKLYISEIFDCFLPETTLIIKENGKVTIREIQDLPENPIGLEVLDKDNTWTKINWIKSKKSDKKISIVKGDGGFLETTEDHKLFNGDEFVEVSELPNNTKLLKIENFDFLEQNRFNTELAYAFGIFLAEGHTSCAKTSTTNFCWQWHIDMGELECLERIKPILEEYTGVDMKIILYPSQTKGSVRGGITSTKNLYRLKSSGEYGDGKILTEIFRNKFYTKTGDKKIPDEILHSDKDSKLEFIKGFLDGDGWAETDILFQASSKSRICANSLVWLANSIGIDTSVYYDNRTYGKRKSCPFMKFNFRKEKYGHNEGRENRIYIEDRGENIVYDINTESGHLFAGGFLVHNCDNYAGSFSSNMAEIYLLNSAARMTVELVNPTTGAHIGWHRCCLIIDSRLDCWLLETQTDKMVKIEPRQPIVLDNWRYLPVSVDIN